MPVDPAVEVRKVRKSFGQVRVLDDISFSIAPGEMVGLIGASGSGKSTLIRVIAGLTAIDPGGRGSREPQGGSVRLFGQTMQQNGRIVRSANALRARVGVVFQQFNLVQRLSVLTNVCLGLLGRMPFLQGTLGRFSQDEKRLAMLALHRVGIAEHALKRGADLSGGQQQRAAIARTLVQGAEFVVADEPIASLDPSSARRVMDILAELNRNDKITVLVSLHQVEYALRYCSRTIALRAGKIVYDGPSRALTADFLKTLYGAESEDLFLSPLEFGPAQVDHPAEAAGARSSPAASDLVAADIGRAARNGVIHRLNA